MSHTETARFSRLSNDLFWELNYIQYVDGQIKITNVKWARGYNDSFWWNEISTSDGFRIRIVDGIKFTLDPDTNVVTVEE